VKFAGASVPLVEIFVQYNSAASSNLPAFSFFSASA